MPTLGFYRLPVPRTGRIINLRDGSEEPGRFRYPSSVAENCLPEKCDKSSKKLMKIGNCVFAAKVSGKVAPHDRGRAKSSIPSGMLGQQPQEAGSRTERMLPMRALMDSSYRAEPIPPDNLRRAQCSQHGRVMMFPEDGMVCRRKA